MDHGCRGVLLVNERAVARARRLIDARQCILDSDWGEVQPKADAENGSSRHIRGTTTPNGTSADGAADGTKARYAFVYGDFRASTAPA